MKLLESCHGKHRNEVINKWLDGTIPKETLYCHLAIAKGKKEHD